jgi:hypothetical protein
MLWEQVRNKITNKKNNPKYQSGHMNVQQNKTAVNDKDILVTKYVANVQ